jgi:ATP-dependent HslUV protease ATP-binding subunit HslU
LDNKKVEIPNKELNDRNSQTPPFDMPVIPGSQTGMLNIGDIVGKTFGGKKQKITKLKVPKAIKHFVKQEMEKLIDKRAISFSISCLTKCLIAFGTFSFVIFCFFLPKV